MMASRNLLPSERGLSPWGAKLHLCADQSNGRSTVRKTLAEGPLQIQRVLYPEGQAVAHAFVLHPPSGIAQEDQLEIRLVASGGSHSVFSSVGIELRSSVIEINSNRYFGISKWKLGQGGLEERALGGSDVEVGLSIPYMPGSKLYHKSFRWDGEEGSDHLKGTSTSLAISGSLIVPGLTLEVGSKYFDNRDRRSFVSLTYAYPSRGVRETPLFSSEMYKLTSMVDRRLEKVRRENLIVKQVRGRGTISFR